MLAVRLIKHHFYIVVLDPMTCVVDEDQQSFVDSCGFGHPESQLPDKDIDIIVARILHYKDIFIGEIKVLQPRCNSCHILNDLVNILHALSTFDSSQLVVRSTNHHNSDFFIVIKVV